MTGLRDITLTVNGAVHRLRVEPRRLLVHCLRQDLGLTGTKVGCETAQCGACVVELDGQPVKSCNLLAVQADGGAILTIEGLTPLARQAQHGRLHPIQQAFHEKHALQCGYCTPGMIMAARAVLQENRHPGEDEIRHALHGNICRCTGYQHIVEAIRRAGEILDEEDGQP